MKEILLLIYITIFFSSIGFSQKRTEDTTVFSYRVFVLIKYIESLIEDENFDIGIEKIHELEHIITPKKDTLNLIKVCFFKAHYFDYLAQKSNNHINTITALTSSHKEIKKAFQLIDKVNFHSDFITYGSYLNNRYYSILEFLPHEEKQINIAKNIALTYNNYVYNKLSFIKNINKKNILDALKNLINISEADKSLNILYKTLIIFKNLKNPYELYDLYNELTFHYSTFNDFTLKIIHSAEKALQYAEATQDTTLIIEASYRLGLIYHSIDNTDERAYQYFSQTLELVEKTLSEYIYTRYLAIILEIYITSNNHDLPKIEAFTKLLRQKAKFVQKETLVFFEDIITLYKNDNPQPEVIQALNNLKESLEYQKVENNSKTINYSLLTLILQKEFSLNNSKATKYYQGYLSLLNNIMHSQKESLYAADAFKDSKIRQKTIEQQQLEIDNLKLQNNLIAIITSLIVVVTLGFFWSYRKTKQYTIVEQENKVLQIQEEINSLEVSMLNKQLDPNEIKSLIDNIAPELEQIAPNTYQQMHQLFNITRASLNTSISEPLSIQLKQAQDFIHLSQKMMSETIDYNFNNPSNIQHIEIPRLLIKNIVENAIKHGIKPKKANGIININIFEKGSMVLIEIKDNGIGNLQLSTSESKQNSTGIGFIAYQKLFQLLNKHNKEKANISIDFSHTGTTVSILIPKVYTYSI